MIPLFDFSHWQSFAGVATLFISIPIATLLYLHANRIKSGKVNDFKIFPIRNMDNIEMWRTLVFRYLVLSSLDALAIGCVLIFALHHDSIRWLGFTALYAITTITLTYTSTYRGMLPFAKKTD